MTVNKVRGRGSYAPLSAHAYKDDALAEAGEAAELLYYRALSFAADVLRDGLVTDSQLIRLVGHGMRDVKKRADRLCAVGLWVREENGYRIRSWLKWNRSVNEINRLKEKDAGRKGGSGRSPNGTDEPPRTESERNPSGIQSESEGSGSRVADGFHTPTPESTPESDTTSETAPRSARKRAAKALPDDWQPSDNHRAFAAEHALNLSHEVGQFRNHAKSHDRRQADWDAAFRMWLGNCVKWDRPRAQQQTLSPFVEQ
jgi:hypothetical protein